MYAQCVRICTKADTFKVLFLSNILIINELNLWHEVRNVLKQITKILFKNLPQ